MRALGPITLAIAFLLELAVLAASAYWGFTRPVGPVGRIVVGLGAPLLMAVLWGLFAAPRASMPLGGVAGAAFQICWFAAGALALATAGHTVPAIALAAAYLVDAAALPLSR